MNFLPAMPTWLRANPPKDANPPAPALAVPVNPATAAPAPGYLAAMGNRLLALRDNIGVALEKKAIVLGKKHAGLDQFAAELPGRIKHHSQGLSDCRAAAAKVTAHFATDFVLNQIKHSKLDPAKPDWTDFFHDRRKIIGPFHDRKIIGPRARKLINEHETLLTDTIHNALLKAFKQFSQHLQGVEQPKALQPRFMEVLGTDLIETAVKHLNSIHTFNTKGFDPDLHASHDAQMTRKFRETNPDLYPVDPSAEPGSPEAYYKELSVTILKIAFPGGAKDLELPTFIDDEGRVAKKAKAMANIDREKLWTLLNQKIVPGILENIFNETTSRHTLNNMILVSLNKLTEPKPPVDPTKPAFVAPQDDLQIRLNKLSGDLIDSFLKNIPETMAGKLMGYSYIKGKAEKIVGTMLREQLQTWDFSKIVDTGIMSGLQNFHPGVWTSPTAPTQFMPHEIQRGPDGLPLKDANGNVLQNPIPGCKFWFANTETEKKAQEESKKLDAAKTERQLEQKIDDMLKNYQGGYTALALAKPKHILLNILTVIVKAITFLACILSFGIPFGKWGWKHISDKITSSIMAPQKAHLITQRKRVMQLLHQPVQATLIRRIAKTGIEALHKAA